MAFRSYEPKVPLIHIPTAPSGNAGGAPASDRQLIGRRKFVDPNSPIYRGPSGQKLFERHKHEADKFNEMQKLVEGNKAKAETAAAKNAESRARFEQTQGAINKRAFRPYEQATNSAYDLLATTPTVTREDELGNPIGRSTMTRQEATQTLLDKFRRANLEDPRIKELLAKQPTSYSDIPLEKPLSSESFKKPADAESGGWDIQGFMRDLVNKGVSTFKGMTGGRAAPAETTPSTPEQDEGDFQEPADQGAEMPQFDSEDEVNAAGLKPGSQFMMYDPQSKRYRPAVYE